MQFLVLFLLALCSVSFAAECFNNLQRTTAIPTAYQIRAVITLETICGGVWRVGDEQQLQNTFNHGYLHFSVQRADNSVPLRYCIGAFEDILAQCIEGAGLWGGSWTLDGEVYYINNSYYPHNPLLPGDDGGPGPCDYPKDEQATFFYSGAARYLQNFLATNGDDNWFFAMEHATTNDQGTPELPSCGEIESHNCSPSKDCREYTSTEFYYVRLVSALINQFFTQAHENFQDQTILSMLSIDEMIADFKPDPARAVDRNLFSIIAGASTIAGAVAGAAASGPAGVPFSLFGGIISIVGASTPIPEAFDIEHIREQASVHLRTIFNETRISTERLLARLFGNVHVKYSLSDLVKEMKNRGFQPVADDWDPTAVIFSMPWMSNSGSVDFTNSFTEGARLMNQGLVGVILKAMGHKVIVIKNFSESECSEIEGSQFIDDDCYAVSSGCGVLVYDYMDAEDIKLLPGKYGIDMVEFFKSVRECSEHGGDPGFASSTGYPACFFSLDFKETNRYYQEKCSIHHGPFDQPCVDVPYYDPPCR
ncbi:hypothetical protein CEP51_006171 [Fusarium floridanum]|uniref:Uncharacterized protein n=1 Tax=Fusarium floridanum TaxID=1325733 RepID=A0A428RU16_9HYPO|nr:hypothetical protein CEP51_006171 [Fusarium floridanum]